MFHRNCACGEITMEKIKKISSSNNIQDGHYFETKVVIHLATAFPAMSME